MHETGTCCWCGWQVTLWVHINGTWCRCWQCEHHGTYVAVLCGAVCWACSCSCNQLVLRLTLAQPNAVCMAVTGGGWGALNECVHWYGMLKLVCTISNGQSQA
jgi:hypothetical protein